MTLLADSAVLQTLARVNRERRVVVPEMQRLWLVTLPTYAPGQPGVPVDVDALKTTLIRVLLALEQQGVERLDAHELFHQPEMRQDSLDLMQFGVRYVQSIDPRDGAGGLELATSGGGAVDESLITDAVQREAAKSDNRQKLGACADATRRHLYVLVSGQERGMTLTALHHVLEETMPLPPAPELPPEITTVWATTATLGLYITPPGPWQTFRIPERIFQDPLAVLDETTV